MRRPCDASLTVVLFVAVVVVEAPVAVNQPVFRSVCVSFDAELTVVVVVVAAVLVAEVVGYIRVFRGVTFFVRGCLGKFLLVLYKSRRYP
jgi:hypothetical protein